MRARMGFSASVHWILSCASSAIPASASAASHLMRFIVSFFHMLRRTLLYLIPFIAALAPAVYAQQIADWTKPFPPFRMIGNIYWVGTWDLSTYLITTPQGHILINTGMA